MATQEEIRNFRLNVSNEKEIPDDTISDMIGAVNRATLLEKAMRFRQEHGKPHYYADDEGGPCVLCGLSLEDGYARCTEPHRHDYPSFEDLGNAACLCRICGISGDI